MSIWYVTVVCLMVTRSPAQVFDSTDICGPSYKVCFRGETLWGFFVFIFFFFLSHSAFFPLIFVSFPFQYGHPLPEVWCQGSPEQLCSRTVHSLSKLYPLLVDLQMILPKLK